MRWIAVRDRRRLFRGGCGIGLGRRIAGIVGIGSRECVGGDVLRFVVRTVGLEVRWMDIVAVVGDDGERARERGGSRGTLTWPYLLGISRRC